MDAADQCTADKLEFYDDRKPDLISDWFANPRSLVGGTSKGIGRHERPTRVPTFLRKLCIHVVRWRALNIFELVRSFGNTEALAAYTNLT